MVLSIVVFSLAASVEYEDAVDVVEVETRETRLEEELDVELIGELTLIVVEEGD